MRFILDALGWRLDVDVNPTPQPEPEPDQPEPQPAPNGATCGDTSLSYADPDVQRMGPGLGFRRNQ